ncbi:hypothetical protein RI367_007679 [Sorochytrium milnesiophthora]
MPLYRCVRAFSTSRALRGGGAPQGGADYATPNDFSGAVWRNLFGGSLLLFGLYKANEMYERQKDENLAHPVTAYIAYHMKNNDYWATKAQETIQYAELQAAKTLVMQEMVDDSPPRLAAPELMERGAPWCISAGQHVHMGNLEIKN